MKYIYEFIGTFLLIFSIGQVALEPFRISFSTFLLVGVILFILSFIRGHYNPAVSLAIFFNKKIPLKDLGYYWTAQILASVAAAFTTLYLAESEFAPCEIELTKTFMIEFVSTFILCYTVLLVITIKKLKDYTSLGWVVGLVVLIIAYVLGNYSKAVFNSAVALGFSCLHLSLWSNLWLYVTANLMGGGFAGFIFYKTHLKKNRLK